LETSNSVNLVVNVKGNLDVDSTAIVTGAAISLTASGTTTVDGSVFNPAAGGANPITIASTGVFTVSPSGAIVTTLDTSPVTLNLKAAGIVNGSVDAQTLNVNASSSFTIGTGGVVTGTADNITAKGAINVAGALGGGTDVFKISTSGAFNVGVPDP